MSPALTLRDMQRADVEAVVRIERSIQAHPWSTGNFYDSLSSGYWCQLAELEGELAGYAVLMPAPDEVHLLTIGIAASFQRQGWGKVLLGRMLELARANGAERMLLEVRPSNVAALALYRNSGFCQIGLRRGYYPAEDGLREDAIVMECLL